MGWTSINKRFTWGTPQQYVLEHGGLEYKGYKIITKSPLLYGGGLCLIYQSTTNVQDIFASIVLIKSDKTDVYWKIMEETCGPFYFPKNKAILKYIPLEDAKGENSLGWRKAAFSVFEDENKPLKINDGNVFKVLNPVGTNTDKYNYFLKVSAYRFQGITDNGQMGIVFKSKTSSFTPVKKYPSLKEFRESMGL
jgi:hypothetical protein